MSTIFNERFLTSIAPSLSHPPLPPSYSEENVWDSFTTLGPPTGSGAFLPGFITPMPALNSATMECLYMNGVFSLPSSSLQDALLQTFVECVLPTMPIVESQRILDAIHDQTGNRGTVSLLLFHAIMFSATTFVDAGHLLDAGYSSRQEAHEALFQTTRVSYSRDGFQATKSHEHIASLSIQCRARSSDHRASPSFNDAPPRHRRRRRQPPYDEHCHFHRPLVWSFPKCPPSSRSALLPETVEADCVDLFHHRLPDRASVAPSPADPGCGLLSSSSDGR